MPSFENIKIVVWGKAGIGLRINPECSTQGDHAIYDPCAPGSRLGIIARNFTREVEADPQILDGVEGLHFHTLCEQNADDLEKTLSAVEEKFGVYLKQMKWLNMGGGHHITREDYDIERLITCICHMKETYGAGSISGTRRGCGAECRLPGDGGHGSC